MKLVSEITEVLMKYTLKIYTLLFETKLKNLKAEAIEYTVSLFSGTISGF